MPDRRPSETDSAGVDSTLTDPGAVANRTRSPNDRSDDRESTGADRYLLGREHGRGGLGSVRRARDLQLGREVAVKELHDRGHSAESRFVREALIAGRLEHPSIVPVHELGRRPDGKPFYAMKLIAGRTLAELIAGAQTLDDRLALLPNVIAVADAIAYAHSRRIIHRDLKPSNIVVGNYGETVVIDWGLAKDLSEVDGDSDLPEDPYRTPAVQQLTMAGQVMGTPAYMSPEQAAGGDVDERSDVFAIGAILYELIAGTPMYVGDSTAAILQRARTRDCAPMMPKLLGVRRDRIFRRRNDGLVAIIERATAFDPASRYAHGTELAAALRADREVERVLRTWDWTDALQWTWGGAMLSQLYLQSNAASVAVLFGAVPLMGLVIHWKRRRIRRAKKRGQALAEAPRKRELMPPGDPGLAETEPS